MSTLLRSKTATLTSSSRESTTWLRLISTTSSSQEWLSGDGPTELAGWWDTYSDSIPLGVARRIGSLIMETTAGPLNFPRLQFPTIEEAVAQAYQRIYEVQTACDPLPIYINDDDDDDDDGDTSGDDHDFDNDAYEDEEVGRSEGSGEALTHVSYLIFKI
ncbi:hypothetical protein CF326_g5448 [Tilletia indica]|nr:hypothetical protein CF326_g5448 [Tilletia indica]